MFTHIGDLLSSFIPGRYQAPPPDRQYGTFAHRNALQLEEIRHQTTTFGLRIKEQLEQLSPTREELQTECQDITNRLARTLSSPENHIRATRVETSGNNLKLTLEIPISEAPALLNTFMHHSPSAGFSQQTTEHSNSREHAAHRPAHSFSAPPFNAGNPLLDLLHPPMSPSRQPNNHPLGADGGRSSMPPHGRPRLQFMSFPFGNRPGGAVPPGGEDTDGLFDFIEIFGGGRPLGSRNTDRGSTANAGASSRTSPSNTSTGFSSDPLSLSRLLDVITTDSDQYKNMKELLDRRAEDLSEVFDQQYLASEWSRPGRREYAEKLMTAISRNMALLRGLNVQEFLSKPPEEQGPFLLQALLSQPNHEKNIQMLAHLKTANFLKEKEPSNSVDSAASPLSTSSSSGISSEQPSLTTETTADDRPDDLAVD